MITVYVLINLLCMVLLLEALVPEVVSLAGGAALGGAGFAAMIGVLVEARRPRAPIRGPGDTVLAVYQPGKEPRCAVKGAVVGQYLTWEAVWRIDRGVYRRDWAMKPHRSANGPRPGADVWVPLSDLVIKERRRHYEYGG